MGRSQATGKVVYLSVHRAARAAAQFGANLGELLSEKILGSHESIGGSTDRRKVLVRDRLPPDPLGDSTLSDPGGGGHLFLSASNLNSLLNCAHERTISAAHDVRQQRRFWESGSQSISVPNMGSDAKKAKPTTADLSAAKRLRAIWDNMPRSSRPRQEAIAEDLGSQSAVSQYLNGKIPLNFRAVMVFSQHLKCDPRLIRDDLSEMQFLPPYSQSDQATGSVNEHELDKVWGGYTVDAKMLAIGMYQAFIKQLSPQKPKEEIHKNAQNDRKRIGRNSAG